MIYYDDNFGQWDSMDEPGMVEFYHQTQSENVEKECDGCGRTVKIKPDYGYCNSCATAREQGMDI